MNNFEIPIFKGKVMRASAQLQAKYYYGGAETRGPLLYEEKTFYEEAINYYNQGRVINYYNQGRVIDYYSITIKVE